MAEPRPDLTIYTWRQGHARLVKHDSGRLTIVYTPDSGLEEHVPVENPYKLVTSLLARAADAEVAEAKLAEICTLLPAFLDANDEHDWSATFARLCRILGARYPAGEVEVEPMDIRDAVAGADRQFAPPESPQPASGEEWLGCHADKDGDCSWSEYPQIRDREPETSGRHCPLDTAADSGGED